MRKIKTWIMIFGICLMIPGCGSSAKDADIIETTKTMGETVTEIAKELETEPEIWSEESMWSEIEFFETQFGDEMIFETMDEEVAVSYGAAIKDSYNFIGRATEEGYGYILGFRNGEKNPFFGYDSYWKDGEFTVVNSDEKTGEEIPMFSLPNIENIYSDDEHTILYIHPEGFEETENIGIAFTHKFGNGEAGRVYLEDAIERGIRFTSPNFGAYLAVYRFENGKRRWEYVPLTREEEISIMQSDALILPEWYGQYGLEFFVSEETYEETGIETWAITDEALKIAEERCNFVAMSLSEIRDLVEVKLEMEVWDEEKGDQHLEIRISEDKILKEIEEIFSYAEVSGEGKCPYTGILTLTREDGVELVISLATDSCSGFVFGSSGFYELDDESAERVWEIFGEARKYTGW